MISRYKQSIFYGGILGVLMLILKWLEMRFLIVNHSFEIYATCIAVIFTALGVWLAHKLGKPKIVEKEIYIEKTTPFVLNEVQLRRLGLTTRELEVLQLMALAKSNQEIADQLFLSLHTIKTHSARLFEKMDVKRRTQAIALGRELSIIP